MDNQEDTYPDHSSSSGGSSGDAANGGEDAGSDEFCIISVRPGAQSQNEVEGSETGAAQEDAINEVKSNTDSREELRPLDAWVKATLSMSQKSGLQFSESVRANKNFRNPSILQKMIAYCGIDEYASHFDEEPIAEGDYYDVLAKRQLSWKKET